MIFELGYTQHGGSGLGYSRNEVLEMEYQEAERFLHLLSDARKRDSVALKSAAKGRNR